MLYAFTSCALNYTPKSLALLQSIREHAPDIKFCLALADDIGSFEDEILEQFDYVFPLASIPELNVPSWIFKHRIVELATAIKPFVLKKILDFDDCEGVFYFDPDMVLFSDLTDMIADLRQNNILLTPHLTCPETTLRGIMDNELSALKHGAYNLGYLGVRNTEEGHRFAEWWSRRLKHFCKEDIPAGIFTDQKWIDLVPCFFEGVHIMRHSGYNVASWNMTHRRIVKENGRYAVNDQPLVFYHFTGFDSGSHAVMSNIYSNGNKDVADLVLWYKNKTDKLSLDPIAQVPWKFLNYDNGVKISSEARAVYSERKDLQAAFPDPFKCDDSGDGNYYDWWLSTGQVELSDDKQDFLPSVTRSSVMRRVLVSPFRFLANSQYRQDVKTLIARSYHNWGLRGVVSLVFGSKYPWGKR